MKSNNLTIESIKKEVDGRNLVDVKLKDMVELLNKFKEDLDKEELQEEKTLDECNSVVFNPLMEQYMGYRKAYIQKAMNKEEFEHLVLDYIKKEEFKEIYKKALIISDNIEINEREELSK